MAILLLMALVYPGMALPGSSFEGNDGNLVVDSAGNTDWSNAPNRVRGDDLPSGTGDNSFGQGTKEDDANVTLVTGSIPPNKSDLTRFYVANEFTNDSNYLTPAYTQTVDVTGNGTYSTTNTTFVAKAAGTWRWQVTYSGDANNEGSTSECGVEHFTLDNGTF